MAFTRVGFDTYLLSSLPELTDASGGAIGVSRYWKAAEASGATTVVDSSAAADSQASGWVGTPTFEAAGYLYGQTNGGNAVTFNGTSQHARLGKATGWLPSIYSTGIWANLLVKMTNGGTFFQYRVLLDGWENAGRTQRGLFIGGRQDGTRLVLRVVYADNAGNTAVWEFHGSGTQHWTEDVFHQLHVQLKLTSGAATTSSMCQLFLDNTPYKCQAHTSATVGAVSDLSSGEWKCGAFSGAGTAGYPSGIGGFTWQRLVMGTGRLTGRQVCDIYREASTVVMGVANPRTAAYFDNASDCGVGGAEGDAISAVTNYGDSGTIVQATSTRQPTWTNDYGGCADFGPGLDATAEPDFKRMTFSRTAGHSYWFTDCSILAVVANVTGGYYFQSSPSIGSLWWDGSFNGLSLGFPAATDSVVPHMRPLVVSTSIAHSAPDGNVIPTCLPTFSAMGVVGGLSASAGYAFDVGAGLGFVDGQYQPHTTSYAIGAWSTPMSGTNYIGPAASGSIWGGLMKFFLATNRPLSVTELDDFWAAAIERWGDYIQADAEQVNMILGDSHSCHEVGTPERCHGWQRRLRRTRGVRYYNLSVRNMAAAGTAGRSLDVRAALAGCWAHVTAKRVLGIQFIGTNDKGGGDSTAQLLTDWNAVKTAAGTAALSASALSYETLGVSLRPGVDDAFNAELGPGLDAPCEYAAQLPEFTLADSIHADTAGMIQIAQAIEDAGGAALGDTAASVRGFAGQWMLLARRRGRR